MDTFETIGQEGGGGTTATIKKNVGSFFDISNKPKKAQELELESRSSLYLFSLNKKEQIHLKLVPQSVSTTYLPRYTSQSPYASARPIQFYVGGTSKRISFTIDLHEQDKASVKSGESVYDLVEKLKGFSVATQGKKRVEDPLVYLQIGEHFAGEGHLETQIEYRLPIREGRYQHIVVTFNFTYHEVYDELEIHIPILDEATATFTDLIITTTGDYRRVYYEPINKFFEGEVKSSEHFVDYVIKNIYEDTKLEKILNVYEIMDRELYESQRQWVMLNVVGDDFDFIGSFFKFMELPGSAEETAAQKEGNQIRSALSIALEMVEFFLSGDFKLKYRIEKLGIIKRGLENSYETLEKNIHDYEEDKGRLFIRPGTPQPVARGWLDEIGHVILIIDSLIATLQNISGAGM